MLIDFEYTGWGARGINIANYCNETMLDNAYPLKNGIALYIQNLMSTKEFDYLIRSYLQHYYSKYFEGMKEENKKSEWLEK